MKDGAVGRTWSLSARLGWRLAAGMLAAILLAAAAVAWRTVATVQELDDSALQNQVRLIAAQLPSGRDSRHIVLPEDLVAPFRASDGDNIFLVYGGEQVLAASDRKAAAAIAPFLPRRRYEGYFRVPIMAGHDRGMVGLATQVGPWRILVAQGREQTAVLLDSLMANFMVGAVWLLLPLGVATVAVGVLTLRRGLRPLREVSAAAARIDPTQTGVGLPVASLPWEVAPLVQAMNHALTRLEQALTVQRRFMAEAAHALRTPLAVLTARLDMLDGQPDAEALRHDVDRMTRLVGQLLRMARLEGLPLDTARSIDLHAIAVEAITDLAPLAVQRGIELALLESQAVRPLRGNHAALVLALTNLIENALSYAPLGTVVEVAVAAPATITVLDRGPGVPEADRKRVFGRFERGPAPISGGAGLGLAIVAEIAAAHGGSVRAVGRTGGGSAFVLMLGGLAAGDHRDDQVLTVQNARRQHAEQVAADQPEQHIG